MQFQIGDVVLVSRDNWEWRCSIIGVREDSGQPPSHYEVRTDDDETFWAFDFEVRAPDDVGGQRPLKEYHAH